MQLSAANYDPQYMRVLVERTIRLGGSYYENGIHNKGPLEPAVYELAGRIGGRSGLLVRDRDLHDGDVARHRRRGGDRRRARRRDARRRDRGGGDGGDAPDAVGQRLRRACSTRATSRSGCWRWRSSSAPGMARGAPNRRRIAAVLVAGLAIGLAVQTLLSACFTAVPVLAWVMWTRRHERVWSRPAWLAVPLVAAVGFLSAPIYYRIFGPWDAFVDGWWTYARWMNTATGRSLGGQFGLGVDQFADYYGDRPVLFVVIVAFLAEMVVRWRALDGTGSGAAGDAGRMVAGGMDRARAQPALLVALLLDPRRAEPADDRGARRRRDAAPAARRGARLGVERALACCRSRWRSSRSRSAGRRRSARASARRARSRASATSTFGVSSSSTAGRTWCGRRSTSSPNRTTRC